VEDYNQTIWQNPALNASYEPFNPYATPSPDPERLPTATPVPTLAPTLAPTAHIAQVGPQGSWATPAPTTQTTGSAWPWLLLALAVIGLGGAYYAYTIHRKNERRRQAVRAQQARQARAQAAQQPQMRAAQNNPQATRSYQPQPAAPYMPPQGGAPRPAPKPHAAPAVTPAPTASKVAQTTNPYRPITKRPGDAYQVPQETRAYPPQQTPARQETVKYAPAPQATQAFKPLDTAPPQETRAYPSITAAPGSAVHQRQRRADRHRDQENLGDE